MRPIVPLAVALAVAVFAAAAPASEVYKWVDQDGRVHYGHKPKRTEAQPLEIQGVPETDPETAQAAAARQAECQRMKSQLDGYRKATVIQETDNLGRTRDYTDEERQQFLVIYEKKTAETCAPPAPAGQSAGAPAQPPAP
jgi:hypothetical protein